ncbi:MAG: CvpA family protein [Holosporaceae bacterium]|jgi:membrane protein required for colicin V production|nr:CvpA family protein [Holosporaceae bacterium]
MNNISFFNWLDYVYIAIMLISTILGFRKGFTRVFLSTCALFGAGFLGAFLTPYMKTFMLNYIMDEYLASTIAAFSSYLVGLIGLFVCIAYISNCIHKTFLSDLDKSAGALVGLIRGLAIPFGVCLMMSIVGVKSHQYDTISNSRISTIMSNAIKNLMPSLSKAMPTHKIKFIYEKLRHVEGSTDMNISSQQSVKDKKERRQSTIFQKLTTVVSKPSASRHGQALTFQKQKTAKTK